MSIETAGLRYCFIIWLLHAESRFEVSIQTFRSLDDVSLLHLILGFKPLAKGHGSPRESKDVRPRVICVKLLLDRSTKNVMIWLVL